MFNKVVIIVIVVAVVIVAAVAAVVTAAAAVAAVVVAAAVAVVVGGGGRRRRRRPCACNNGLCQTTSCSQVPALTCRISILHKFEPCAHAFDWQVGVSLPQLVSCCRTFCLSPHPLIRHGVLLNFSDSHGRQTNMRIVMHDHAVQRFHQILSRGGFPQHTCQKWPKSTVLLRHFVLDRASICKSRRYDPRRRYP